MLAAFLFVPMVNILVGLLFYTIICGSCGALAKRYGYSGVFWGFLALALSPIMAYIILLSAGPRNH
jgi:hypothetical protein